MRTLLTAVLLFLPQLVLSCVDLLLVLDPSSELSRPRATKVANELTKRNGLRFSIATRRHGNRYVLVMAKNSADLISQLDAVDGDYERYLSMVTSEIGRRKHGRSLVVLLFSEREVKSTLVETWKKLSANGKAHVFRVGNAKTTNELLSGDPEEKSFEGLIACSGAEGDPLEIRRRPAITSTLTSSRRPQIQFSKTTPRPTTPRPTTIPGPKLRPVFRRKDKELGQFETAPSIKSAEASRDIISKPLFTTPKAKSFARSLNEADIGTQSKIAATSSVLSPTRTPTSFRTFNQSSEEDDIAEKLTSVQIVTRATTTTPTTTTPRAPPGCVADIIFLMDFSDGTGDKSKRYLDIAAAAVGHLPIATNAVRVSLIRYSGPGRAETLFHLDKHAKKDDLIEELFRMEPTGGTTRTGEAIQYAVKEFENKKHGARKNARKFVVVFTDGYSQEDPSAAAEAARAEGVLMIAVAVDDKLKPNEEELMEITRRRDMVLISPNGKQLREKILGNQCPL